MTDSLRIGLGIDVHRLAPGRPCILGGVELDAPVGPLAHSDGDAVLHALCDAVLGAAGLDDLGTLFPDTDARHRGRPSSDFCRDVMDRVQQQGLRVLSLDVVIEVERPAIKPHRRALRRKIAELFDVAFEAVNVKGKSGEGLGAVGRGEAVRATAVALLATAG